MTTKRLNPPPIDLTHLRRVYGQLLLDWMTHYGITRVVMSALVGFSHPKSITQIISGGQGASYEVYARIAEIIPEMRQVAMPPYKKVAKQLGCPGPHKTHDYPEGTVQSPRIKGRLPPKFPT